MLKFDRTSLLFVCFWRAQKWTMFSNFCCCLGNIYIGPTFKLSTYFFLFTLERRQLGVTICVSGTCSCCSETRIFDYIDQS